MVRRSRAALWIVAILAFAGGGLLAYVALTVPNDVKAETLMRQARDDIRKQQTTEARTKLQKIVTEYPRTDAAAAASSALFALEAEQNNRLSADVNNLTAARKADQARIRSLEQRVDQLAKRPPPAPPPPPAVKKAPVKKKAPVRKKTTKRTTRKRR